MTIEQAKRIIVTSSYTEYGTALVQMDLITPSQYEYDYNATTQQFNRLTQWNTAADTLEVIRLATIIEDNRRDK